MSAPLLPGATIGVLGGGQLGRMIALEARRMGYRVCVLDTTRDCAAGQLASDFVVGSFNDRAAAMQVAARSDVVTVETEHIPAEVLSEVETKVPVRPRPHVLATVQDRLVQRQFLARIGAPQTRFAQVSSLADLQAALPAIGLPCILKTRRSGYDGKGQVKLNKVEDAEAAWRAVGEQPSVLEMFVAFEREVSIVLARGLDGAIASYPLVENDHRGHILHASTAPARVGRLVHQAADELARGVAEALDHVGVLALEMFLLPSGTLLVNEIAPRVHNSGHFTFGACATSQFEQHTRAIVGLPLGDPSLLRPVTMINLLGDLWSDGEPNWLALMKQSDVRLHLYGKYPAKMGRKMGHFIAFGDTAETSQRVAAEGFAALRRPYPELT